MEGITSWFRFALYREPVVEAFHFLAVRGLNLKGQALGTQTPGLGYEDPPPCNSGIIGI